MNTIEEVQTEIDALVVAMGGKGVVMPRAELWVKSGEEPKLHLWANDFSLNGKGLVSFTAGTPAESLTQAQEFIASLPDAAEAVQTEYLRRVGHAVDYATENALAEEYVAPLRGVTCAMTDNLLMNGGA